MLATGVYIKGIGAISPQKTFDANVFEKDFLSFMGNRLKCIEPDYSLFIDAKQIRRMSRIIKMGVASSIKALKEAGIEKPGAVIVGTAFGCLEDTDIFLKKLVQNKEEMLNPTAFIHSTHNTIASQIALMFQCMGYNSTYVHRNISFESALMDAFLLLKENAVETLLVGGIDELTESSFTILNRLGHYKKSQEVNSENLYNINSKGSVAGEGSAFFALVNKPDSNCYAKVCGVQTLSFVSAEELASKAKILLSEHKIDKADILIAGYNGDTQDDAIFNIVASSLDMQNDTLRYKHLCGEYPTSTAFAMWMASEIIKKEKALPIFGYKQQIKKSVKNVLIYNQNKNLHHSLILLSAC